MNNIKKILITMLIELLMISSIGCTKSVTNPAEEIKNSPVAEVNKENITKEDPSSKTVSTAPELIEKSAIIANVDGEIITKEAFDLRMLPVKNSFAEQYNAGWENNADYKQQFYEEKVTMRQSMINDILILKHAKMANIIPTAKEIDDEVKIQFNETLKQSENETALVESLKRYGFTKESYMSFLKDRVTVAKSGEGLLKDLKLDDAKVKAEYETNKNIKYTKKPNLMHIQLILVDTKGSADAVVDRINKGEGFDIVAKSVSIDTLTKDKNGDFGDYYYNEELNSDPLESVVVTASMALAINTISSPIQTSKGWYVLKVTKRELSEPELFEKVKDSITTNLMAKLKNETMTSNIKKWVSELGNKLIKEDKNM